MEGLQTEVSKAQEKTKEQVAEFERKCCGKPTEHHEYLTDVERKNEGTVQEIQAQTLNVVRMEQNLDGTEQKFQEQIQSYISCFVQHFLLSFDAKIDQLEINTPPLQRKQF